MLYDIFIELKLILDVTRSSTTNTVRENYVILQPWFTIVYEFEIPFFGDFIVMYCALCISHII